MKLYDAQGREKLPVDTAAIVATPVGRILGQAAPSARTLTALYIVPSGARANGVKIFCTNRGPKVARFRISHALAGAADSVEQYLYYDEFVPPFKSFEAISGFDLGATDELRVYSDNGQVSFNAYGEELTP